jgi:hypothetical protein
MPTPAELLNETGELTDATATETLERKGVFTSVAWTGLVFATLQSVCTVLVGLGAGRLIVSVLSVAAASATFKQIHYFHQGSYFRIPMMLFALVGAVMNLVVVWQVRRLRSRPSAQWRIDKAALPKQLRQERWMIGLSELTLVLLLIEEVIHRFHLHKL